LDASQVLAMAREALGGDQKLASVKTFVATGRTRQIRGNNLVPIEFEINCELPDAFVRRDEIPAQDTDPTTAGFKGDELIQFPALQGPQRAGTAAPPNRGGGANAPDTGRSAGAPPDAGRGAPQLTPAQQRVIGLKQDFARLMLGVFATSFPTY